MKLRDVVDLEAQLALDEGQDEAILRSRDRALYLALSPAPAQVDSLLSAWLEALRARFGAPALGERVAGAQRLLAYVLALTGIVSGWGTAEVLLRFEQGAAPVNVGHFLLVIVFGQLSLLSLLALGLLLRRVWPGLPLVGDFARLLRFLAARLQTLLRGPQPELRARLDSERAVYQRVRTRLGLYERVERALLLSQSQLFGVAFNLGVLASCMRLIFLSDLAFGWSTSVASLDAAQVHRVCSALSTPFAWVVPDAVPTRALIEHTQYFRLEGRFAGAQAGTRGDALLVGGWWRFLIACTVTYGLLPRLLAYGLFAAKLRRAERDVPLDTPAVQRVVMRMTTPALSTRAHEPLPQGAEPPLLQKSVEGVASASTTLVLYRDIPTDERLLRQAVEQELGVVITGVHRAGGLDVRRDAELCRTLGAQSEAVALVAEAWEAPDKSLRQLLAALRTALGPRRSLRVILIGEASAQGFTPPAAEDVRVYRDRLTLLDDPYLIIETLGRISRPPAVDQEVRS